MITLISTTAIAASDAVVGNPPPGYYALWVDDSGTLMIRDSAGVTSAVHGDGGGVPTVPLDTPPGSVAYADGSGILAFAVFPGPGKVLGTGADGALVWLPASEGGAGGSLAGLSDVHIAATPSDTRVLTFDPDTGKWQAYTVDAMLANAGYRQVPRGGVAGQVLTLDADGVTLVWHTPQSGGSGGGGGGGIPSVLMGVPISSNPYNTSYASSYAFDNDPSTFYSSLDTEDGWLGLDFRPQSATPTLVRLMPRTGTFGPSQASGLAVEGSADGVTWTQIATTGASQEGTLTDTPIPSGAGAWPMIRVRNHASYLSISQLQIVGTLQ